MKTVLSILLLIVAALALFLFVSRGFDPNADLASTKGTFSELGMYLAGLKNSSSDDAFLIVTLAGTEDFLQFIHTDRGYEVDLPLITRRQQSYEQPFSKACGDLGLPVDRVSGEDGYRFIDAYIQGTPEQAGRVASELFRRVYGAPASADLVIQWNGFEKRELK